MPPDSGMAFVLIQHLDPTHASMMGELLSVHTRMRVVEVTDGMLPGPNHVYLVPPGAPAGPTARPSPMRKGR